MSINPQVPPDVGLQLLEDLITQAESLLSARPLTRDEHGKWELIARNYLEKAFGSLSPNIKSVTDVGKYGSFPMHADEEWWEQNRADDLRTQIKRLEGLVELLKTEQQLDSGAAVQVMPSAQGHRIFLVHGHDEAVLQNAARFLEHIEQEVVVLHEQPNQGRTIIEKFEDYADVGFAVVLLTPDDVGGKGGVDSANLQSRARQNVIMELGYFLGRLGRSRVCALYVPGVEIPSDYAGVLYVELDDKGGWRLELARELVAAGFEVDMNKAL